ncbi:MULTISPECIES: S9 family peptidase [unclassified Streptomyces]|uniref:S9 family peptidase n=1 Tax=unclassified Streptomyces TaxID=2593676 RepID=UPI000DC78C02|nr:MULTISPECIES: S9 family peptidase [unclassified Streptomyces]AWZ06451.1 S9 family peptidase [Streptomyces sp. ICC4]AWZ13176.1 S9 family peptidase [Streptomyces sp. ICC1]
MTTEAVPLIPHSVLFGNPSYLVPEVSPDGTRLLFLAPDDGVLNVWVAPVDRPDEAKAVTHDRGRGIRTYGLCHDDRTLFYLRDENGDESWRVHLVDLVSGEERCATPFDGVQARVLAHNRWHPNTVLIGLNKDRPGLHDVYSLDLLTDRLTKIAENPGYLSWIIDTDLRIRGGTAMKPDGGLSVFLDPPDGEDGEDGRGGPGTAPPWLDVPYEDALGTRVIGFARDGATCHLLSSIGANAGRLFEVEVATGRRTLLAQDPVYDVKQVETDPVTRRPQAVLFAKDRDEWVFLDEEFGKDIGRIRGELALRDVDGEVYIDRTDRSGRLWTVSVVTGAGPVLYYVYDRADGGLRYLFSHQEELERYRLARMEPFEFTARDGVTVHGYVTWPPGAERGGLPAVVNVHGGPWARHTFAFDEEAQLLANRGYACVQVNFRGSTGYGKHFRNLGAKQWGAAMQTDLLDALAYFVADGRIDASRVAIMGCSYGGYAALVGAAFTPEVFTCAIDLCGPSNLLTMLAAGAPYRTPLRSFMSAQVGDPETDRDMLWERSPLSRVDDIRIPILVVQGANDVRVPRAEAEQIVAALAAKGLAHEYLLFPDEGHGLARPANRQAYYAAVERFLAAHMG